MRSFLCYSTILVLLSGICSCRKHHDHNAVPSDFLSKIIIQDSANPAKGIQVCEFLYDDQNRVTELAFWGGDSSNGALNLKYDTSFRCFYKGNDKMPYKTTGFSMAGRGIGGEIYRYYNSAGLVIKDSTGPTSYQPTGYFLQEYTYADNKILNRSTNAYSFPDQHLTDSMAVQNGNITALVYATSTSAPFRGKLYSYDDKINPLSLLNISGFMLIDGLSRVYGPAYSKNNMTQYADVFYLTDGTVVTSSTFRYAYSYNSKNLPVECHTVGYLNPYTVKFYYSE